MTTAKLRDLLCAHCGKEFVTECAPAGGWEDDAVPYINKGLMEVRESDGSVLYYHGYKGRGCYAEAVDESEFVLGDKKADDAMGEAVENALKDWFAVWAPKGSVLTNVSYNVTFNWRRGALKFSDSTPELTQGSSGEH